MPSIFKESARRFKLLFRKSSRWPIGYAIIAGVIATRWAGLFSTLELTTLDFLLRNRPPEEIDEQIVLVLFDRNSVENDSEISEQAIADLLNIIFSADPAVVGLNILLGESSRDSGRDQLVQMFKTHENLIGVEKALPPRLIAPPGEISLEIREQQFGLNDVPIDQDGRVRRSFIGAYLPDENDDPQDNPFKFSFSFKLAKTFLEQQGYALDNHLRNPDVPVFRHPETNRFTAIPILNKNSGGYFREINISKLQTLLNFRSGLQTFEILNALELLNFSGEPDFLQDKIVIVGGVDTYFPRVLPVSATSNLVEEERGRDGILPRIGIVGSELEAHSASQIINATLRERSLIRTLPGIVEDFLIIFSGLFGIAISISQRSTVRSAIALLLSTLAVFSICYLSLDSFGLWLPVTPIVVCLPLAGMAYLGFNYSSQRRALRSKEAALIEVKDLEAERRKAIERAFSAIHAGPLQRLSALLRTTKDGKLDQDYIIQELRSLNQEIRGIGERLRQEAIEDVYFFFSQGDIKLDLTHPMHEVLYEVYSLSVQRKLPGFETVKVRAVSIEPFNCQQLHLDIKRQLCWFLEESLHNIGKHAIGTTRIKVSGKHQDAFYSLRIEDNGPGIQSTHIGEGTQAFYRLEAVLCGKFSRCSKPGGGTICELSWPSSTH